MENSERKKLKDLMNTRYPSDTFDLDLEDVFEYYGGYCYELLTSITHRKADIYPLDSKIEEKIINYIKKNDNEFGKEMEDYLNKLKQAIPILQKHYSRQEKRVK